jgi:pimeloyl-ACP methyl ester carboxylesterase
MTWMQAINDLQSYPEIRDHFQFWFYLYPTGEPFPVTAAALRRDLAQLRQTFVAGRAAPELDQMVLVGHSMGGLIARSLAIDGPDAMQSVTRVVTIATPFRGSDDSNDVTRWLARQVIRLPKNTMNATRNFLISGSPASKNPQDFDDLTSIDTLSPKSPILQALLERRPLPAVTFHNVIGVTGSKPRESGSDGIVTYASAHLDDVASQLVVPAAHMHVHQHPRTILELRRILGVHLQALGIPAAAPIQLLHGRDEAAVEEHPETEGDPQRRTAEPVFDSL